jgi:hypothetical protein
MPSTNIKPVIRSQASQIRPSLFCIFPSFDIFGLNKCLTTPPSVGSIHFKQSSVSWAEQALRKVTPTARHQESVLLYCVNVGLLRSFINPTKKRFPAAWMKCPPIHTIQEFVKKIYCFCSSHCL